MARRTQSSRRARPEQLPLAAKKPRTWGGARAGAGRPRRRDPGNPHRARPHFPGRLPLHVTLRMTERVYNLRSRRSFRVIERAFLEGGADRFGMHVVHFSVQGNHLHLLVEATDRTALSRAMKGLGVRLARGLNRMMGRRGQVIDERYHARALRTPTEVRNALHYVRNNHQHHAARQGRALSPDDVDPYSSDAVRDRIPLRGPETWLLSVGWKRGRAGRPLRGRR